MKAIKNGVVIVPDERGDFHAQPGLVVLYDRDQIKAVVSEDAWAEDEADDVVDAQGLFVGPGFLNVHIHGCGGSDTMDATPEDLEVMSRVQASSGVTGFLPTTMTCTWEEIVTALENVRWGLGHDLPGARVLGAHMEGPFISPQKKGSQKEDNIRKAEYSLIAPFADVVRLITLAPEELPDYSFVQRCRQAGITISIGHTAADYDTAFAAVQEQGIHHFTHTYNAMTPFQHREPGVVGAALDTDANCELIADNVHCHPAAQRLLYRAKGGQHIILVTDSMRAAGLGDGISELGGQKVFVKGERATLADGTIAASVASLNSCMRHFSENTGAPLPRVVEMVTRTPALDLGLYDEVGSIEPGKRADLTIFDSEFAIRTTIVGGQVAG